VEYASFLPSTPGATLALVNGGFHLVTSGSTACTATLPTVAATTSAGVLTAEGAQGPVAVKKVDTGSGVITIKTADGTTIDGIAGTTGITLAKQYDTVVLVSDGTNWWTVSGNLVTTEAPE
jgi:hypothetical protein